MTDKDHLAQIVEAGARSLANVSVAHGDTVIDALGQHHDCPERVCSNAARAALIAGLRKAAELDTTTVMMRSQDAYAILADDLSATKEGR